MISTFYIYVIVIHMIFPIIFNSCFLRLLLYIYIYIYKYVTHVYTYVVYFYNHCKDCMQEIFEEYISLKKISFKMNFYEN